MTASSAAEEWRGYSRPGTRAEEPEALPPATPTTKSPGPPTVIAVGSGKGGVGKTVVSSSLALALAETGDRPVVAIDVDLGGANLHNGLGIPRPDFAMNRFILDGQSLDELVASTNTPRLSLIGGASDIVGLSEFGEAAQQRFLAELGSFHRTTTILDLGAGSSLFNLDLFRRADQGVLVLTPEPTAVQNAYGFLRATAYRRIRADFRGEEGLHEIIDNAMNHRRPDGASSIPALLNEIARYNRSAADRIERTLSDISVGFIVNVAAKSAAEKIADRFSNTVRRYLGIEIDFLGGVVRDEAVSRAICEWRPLLTERPRTRAARNLRSIAVALSRKLSAGASVMRAPAARYPKEPGCR